MVEYKEGHKNSKGEDAPWCIVSHETGKVISSHKSKSSAERHLKDIQMFKHMKNESMISSWFADIKFKKENEEMTIEEAKEILSKSGKKAVNESFLEDAGVEELYELAMKTLSFADQVHCWHWCCQSGFQHTHFEAIYDALRDFADELVEVCLASGKNIRFNIQSEMKADSMNFEAQEAVEEIEDFIDTVQATGEKFEDYSEITAVFDDISKTLSKELGLIKNFI